MEHVVGFRSSSEIRIAPAKHALRDVESAPDFPPASRIGPPRRDSTLFDRSESDSRIRSDLSRPAPIGNHTAYPPGCTKSDAVLQFTDVSAFAGAPVVFEAKREASYTALRVLDELDPGRRNRAAFAGVFAMARSHASDAFPRFARYGNSVLVIWDDEDPSTAAYLQAAVLLGMALVTRSKSVGDEADIAALRDIETRTRASSSGWTGWRSTVTAFGRALRGSATRSAKDTTRSRLCTGMRRARCAR
jgi:hypothetical protein